MMGPKSATMFSACLIALCAFVLCAVDGAGAQACTFSVSPAKATAPVNGLPDPNDPRGASSRPPKINVTASKAECSWSASSGASWIQLLSSGGAGSGTVQYRVTQNTTGTPRTGTMQVAGKTVTIQQDSDTVCKVVSVSPTSVSVREQGAPEAPSDPRGGVSGPPAKLAVTTSKAGCRWEALGNAPWINVLTRRGTGSGYVEYRVLQNTSGKPRTGTINVEGKIVTINQEYAGACSVSVSPVSVSVAWHGSDSSDPRGASSPPLKLTLSSSKANCPWTATTSAGWIQIMTASGSGSGTVQYRVPANKTGAPRTGTMQVAGKTVTVKQEAGSDRGAPAAAGTTKNNCKATILPTRATVESKGTTGTFKVTTGDDCAWSAKTRTPWIHITSGASSKGSGAVQYTVDENRGAKRKGTITVSGKTFSIGQKEASKRKDGKTLEKETKKAATKQPR
ncbi:MAG TPA: BACON domain-containing carbohydrate-binding protein [Syntrophorhabdaceae bacterium]|nr:BACON domain-containing carbohydrate-binding protein [Syntrophorhabdaceae bacterium]